MAADTLSRYNVRGRDLLFLVTLATIMVPLQVILIPVFQVTAPLGLTNSLWGVILPRHRHPHRGVPAAPVHAHDPRRTHRLRPGGRGARVRDPLAGDAAAVQAGAGCRVPAGQEVVPFNLVLAISVVSMIPVLICFLVFQKQIVQGIVASGMT